jgi:hypothetical protein
LLARAGLRHQQGEGRQQRAAANHAPLLVDHREPFALVFEHHAAVRVQALHDLCEFLGEGVVFGGGARRAARVRIGVQRNHIVADLPQHRRENRCHAAEGEVRHQP